jgi:hypothetical protein
MGTSRPASKGKIEKGHSKGHYAVPIRERQGLISCHLLRNAGGAGCYLIFLPDKTSAPRQRANQAESQTKLQR